MSGDGYTHLETWSQAVQIQASRILMDGPWPASGEQTRQADCYLFLVALRDVRRAAALVGRQSGLQAVSDAVEAFDSEMPHVTNLRDVLEHFDDYAIGEGRLAKGQVPFIWYERGINTYSLHVGMSRGPHHLTVEVRAAAEAADRLADAIRAAHTGS